MFFFYLFCLAFSFCQIALAFLCWMLISVGFYFGLQKITRTKNRASFKYQSHFYANNTTYFTLFHFIIIILFIYFFFLGGGRWVFFVLLLHAMIPLAKNLPCIKISLPLKSEASLAVYSHHACSIVVLDDMGMTATFKKTTHTVCMHYQYLLVILI